MIARIEDSIQNSGSSAFELTPDVSSNLAQFFKLFADETRLRILVYLTDEGELSVTDLCNKLGHSQPAVSHHLALMRVAGLIHLRREGKFNFYSVQPTSTFRDVLRFFDVIENQEKAGGGAEEVKQAQQINEVSQAEACHVHVADDVCFDELPAMPAVPAV